MNTLLTIGTRVVVLALAAYSIAILTEQKKRSISNFVLLFLTLGIVLDITATIFMIMGSPNSPFTIHGFLGYSALLAMLIDCYFIWKVRLTQGANASPSNAVHLYSRYAYLWWVIAFVTGGLLVVFK
jgi:hypothetical protein